MAKYRRYFPVSHDINHDPEILELKDQFGLGGFSLWLEILAITDRTEGRLLVTSYWLRNVCKLVGQRFATGLVTLNHIIKKGWLEPNEPFVDGLETVYMVSNFAEYHRKHVPNKLELGYENENIGVPPNHPTNPNHPNHPKEKNSSERIHKEKGKNGPPKSSSRQKLEAFTVDQALRDWASKKDLPNPDDWLDDFKNYWLQFDDKVLNRYVDWRRTFQNRLNYIKDHPDKFPKEQQRQGAFI